MRTIYDSRLLLVDDNVELCRMLTDMLRRGGFFQCGGGKQLPGGDAAFYGGWASGCGKRGLSGSGSGDIGY
jgi:hypothetical protein